VLAFPAAEVASLLDTSVAAANSALQRARATMSQRIGDRSQQATIAALGDQRLAEIVGRLVTAWERADVPALVEMLAEDVRFAMPPFRAWFDGRAAVIRFIGERVFATPWRMVPASANGQLAFACYQLRPGEPGEPGAVGETKFRLSAINVLTLRGDRVVEITGFLDRDVFARFPFPREYPG
jgi:RNA polymerase sigma-70 factor (ECF subfamily)